MTTSIVDFDKNLPFAASSGQTWDNVVLQILDDDGDVIEECRGCRVVKGFTIEEKTDLFAAIARGDLKFNHPPAMIDITVDEALEEAVRVFGNRLDEIQDNIRQREGLEGREVLVARLRSRAVYTDRCRRKVKDLIGDPRLAT